MGPMTKKAKQQLSASARTALRTMGYADGLNGRAKVREEPEYLASHRRGTERRQKLLRNEIAEED